MHRLPDKHPDFLDPNVMTVGITDTSYGEDHAWTDYFKAVVDINSPNPFAPIVSADSPLREIHSAHVLTQAEREQAPGHRRRQAHASLHEQRFSAPDLSRHLDGVLGSVDRLSERYQAELDRLRHARTDVEQRIAGVLTLIEGDVQEFNASQGDQRKRALQRLRRHLRQGRSLKRRLIKIERPLAGLTWSLTELLEASRAVLGQESAS